MLKHPPILRAHYCCRLAACGAEESARLCCTSCKKRASQACSGTFIWPVCALLPRLYVHGLPAYMKHRAKSIMVRGSKLLSAFLARSVAPVCPSCHLGCHPPVSAAHLPWESIKALALACLFFSSKQVHQAEYSFKQA